LPGHPLTQLVMVIIGCAAVSAVFGLLKALRGPVGTLAYGALMVTFYAYYRMGDRYFSQGIWQISIGCLVVMAFTLRHVPFLRTVLAVGLVEFGSRINRTAYPHETVLALGVIGAMIAIATFWSGKSPAAAPPPPPPPSPRQQQRQRPRAQRERVAPAYRPGPEPFDPFTGQRMPQTQQKQRTARLTASALWRWARGSR
jgi:hypothetical protein